MSKSKKTKQSKITLEKLALMMGKGFNEVHEKIDNVKVELKIEIDDLKTDVAGLKTQVNKIDKKFDNAIGKQDETLKRVEDLETDNKMDMLFRKRVEKDIDQLKNRVVVLETKVRK